MADFIVLVRTMASLKIILIETHIVQTKLVFKNNTQVYYRPTFVPKMRPRLKWEILSIKSVFHKHGCKSLFETGGAWIGFARSANLFLKPPQFISKPSPILGGLDINWGGLKNNQVPLKLGGGGLGY